MDERSSSDFLENFRKREELSKTYIATLQKRLWLGLLMLGIVGTNYFFFTGPHEKGESRTIVWWIITLFQAYAVVRFVWLSVLARRQKAALEANNEVEGREALHRP